MKVKQLIFFYTASFLIICSFPSYGAVREMLLDCGTKIITLENKESKTASVNVFVRAGSSNETEKEGGISHFLEHLLFRGTSSLSGMDFKKNLEAIGAYANAETSRDYTRYYMNLPAENVYKGLELMIDALKNASLKEDDIEQERKVILEEFSLYKTNESRRLFELLSEMAYQNFPYSKPTIGSKKNIKSFSRRDLIEYREKFYRPSNLIFVITGNFSTEQVENIIKKAFKEKKRESSKEQAIPFEPVKKSRRKEVRKGSSHSIIMAFYGPEISSPEIYPADIACFLLAIGKGSILQRYLVEKDNNFESISIDFQTMKYKGLIIISAKYKGYRASEAYEKLLSEINRISLGNFSDEEMERAKTMLINTTLFSYETNEGAAHSLGRAEAIYSWKFELEYPERIKKTGRKELIKFAEHLKTPVATISVTPERRDNDE